MHKNKALPAFAAAVLLFGIQAAAIDANAQAPAPVVKVAAPLTERIIEWDEYTGRFVAVESVDLQARVSGYLDSIHFREGDLVQAGDLLYEIDRRPFEAAVNQADARLDAAIARLDLAQIELNRARELLNRDVGSRSEAQRRHAEHVEATADVSLAEAQLQTAELDLEFTRITAPITGRISATAIDAGNLVPVGGPMVLANIVTLDPIEFVFTVSEADFLRYARLDLNGSRPSSRDTENPVLIRLLDEDGWPREGRMTFVDNRIDPNTGTLEGRATIANPDRLLQPGLFGHLRLPGSVEYEAILIPDEAVLSDQSSLFVYVVGDDDVVSERPVTLGPLHRVLRVIRDGVGPADRVVVSGIQRVRPGAIVSPEPTELAFSQAP